MTTYYYIFAQNGTCPKGFSSDSTYNNKTLSINGSTFGSTGGNATVTHNHNLSTFPVFNVHSYNDIDVMYNYLGNTNVILDPKTIKFTLCKTDKLHIVNTFTKGSIIILNDTTNICPTGWEKIVSQIKNVVATNGTVGEVTQSNNHKHTVSYPESNATAISGTYPRLSYVAYSGDSDYTDVDTILPYVTVTLCKKL